MPTNATPKRLGNAGEHDAALAALAGGGGIAVAYRYYDPTRTIRVARRDYPYRMQSGTCSATRKLLLLK